MTVIGSFPFRMDSGIALSLPGWQRQMQGTDPEKATLTGRINIFKLYHEETHYRDIRSSSGRRKQHEQSFVRQSQ
ncbi:hypothetical protein J31TS4_26550 [Paenibacillus sp. J31TS4]|nr:hypothetical protein J31TS4_26550 [Paenibacillus sp. J31TS4]